MYIYTLKNSILYITCQRSRQQLPLDVSCTCRRTLEDMFADFAEKPVASGSIAQIHKAHLSASGAQNSDYPPGTTVAVKVL